MANPSVHTLRQLTATAIAHHQALHEHHRTLAQRSTGAHHMPAQHVVPLHPELPPSTPAPNLSSGPAASP